MADNSAIEWTDATWNPITGCAVVSPGCTNCYAMRLAGTRLRKLPSRAGLTRPSRGGHVWTGETRWNGVWLDQPLRWRRPRRIFVCAHGDIFAESVPDSWIDRVFAVMAMAPQHTFQVLTKRSARMRAYCSNPATVRRIYEEVCELVVYNALRIVLVAPGIDASLGPPGPRVRLDLWPLPHVWLGVSAEDQARADERVPDLLATPAAVHFVSAEPLLAPIDFDRLDVPTGGEVSALTGHWSTWPTRAVDGGRTVIHRRETLPRLDWIIVGGESGPLARLWVGFADAARTIHRQCEAAGVAFFMKQMAGRSKAAMPPIPADLMVRDMPRIAA